MIAIPPVLSTSPRATPAHAVSRRALVGTTLATSGLLLTGCAGIAAPVNLPAQAARIDSGAFVMPDAARLPFRAWLPAGPPRVVALALHGINDSRDAWEVSAPVLTTAGFAVYAPDQRGFGTSPGRGFWAGGDAMVADAREMARLLRANYPGTRMVLIGESMGAAVLMRLATEADAPPDASYVLVAPAVWGRARMNLWLRGALWLAYQLIPSYTATRAPGITVTASSNREALIRLSRDPLTIHATRIDTIKGLVDLMDAALLAAERFTAPGLFLYGGRDELVPAEATHAMWRRLPPGARLGFYRDGYHLMLRDLGRTTPLTDIVSWTLNPAASLPSGAGEAARAWLAAQA